MRYYSALAILLLVTFIISFIPGHSAHNNLPRDELVNTEGIRQLLEIMHMVRERNPDYIDWTDRLVEMNRSQRKNLLDSLSARNREDIELGAAIDSLLSSETYRLYYRKFNNVTPDDHRQMLLNLPYGWLPSPADISRVLYEICHNSDSIADWVGGSIDAIDLDSVQQRALQWLPEGNYQMPPIHFIMDGNGDAFALGGQVCFDLYGLVLGKRSSSTRYSNLAKVSVSQIEVVLAHEFHHVYAAPFFKIDAAESDNLYRQWRNRLVCSMASEGIAMHCNPPEGYFRILKEDTAIVAFWFREFDSVMSALNRNVVSEDDIRHWYRDSFHDTARRLLREYMSRTFQGDELNQQVALHAHARPTLIYTLGWWMVSRISDNGVNRQAVLGLLQDPLSLFSRYNAVIGDGPDSLGAP
jgi:hypothetical protein